MFLQVFWYILIEASRARGNADDRNRLGIEQNLFYLVGGHERVSTEGEGGVATPAPARFAGWLCWLWVNGSATLKQVCPGRESTVMRPGCLRPVMLYEICRPKPLPR